jgi:hypothetical protein
VSGGQLDAKHATARTARGQAAAEALGVNKDFALAMGTGVRQGLHVAAS